MRRIASVPVTVPFIFGGKPGIKPFSYRLHADGNAEEFSVYDDKVNIVARVSLKKGATIYVELQNDLHDPHKPHIHHSWRHQNNGKYQFHQPGRFHPETARNLPS